MRLVRRQRMRAGERFLHGVQRRRADIAEDDADGAEREGSRALLFGRGCVHDVGLNLLFDAPVVAPAKSAGGAVQN